MDGEDNCPNTPNLNQANYDEDENGDVCDLDDDNDSIEDSVDSCPKGWKDWTSAPSSDYDADGCLDQIEDDDDDNDGYNDTDEECPYDANYTTAPSYGCGNTPPEGQTPDESGQQGDLPTELENEIDSMADNVKGFFTPSTSLSVLLNIGLIIAIISLRKKKQSDSLALTPKQMLESNSNMEQDTLLTTPYSVYSSVMMENKQPEIPPVNQEIVPIVLEHPSKNILSTQKDVQGYEWLGYNEKTYYRIANSNNEWQLWN